MKKLQEEFQANADGVGLHIFKQLKRIDDIALYQRIRVKEKTTHSYEVIKIKVIKAGTPLPGGQFVKEDYERYPGAHAFGFTGWTFWNKLAAEQRFNDLVNKKNVVVDVTPEDMDTEEVAVEKQSTEKPAGKRGRKPKDRSAIKFPSDKFTMKQLEALNPDFSFAFLYQHLRSLLNIQYKIVEAITGGRGKPTLVYASIDSVESTDNFEDSVKNKLNS